MKLDLAAPGDLVGTGAFAADAERLGFGGVWFAEAAHSALLGCAVAVERTERITVGTAIAVAFARSPMVTAQAAWDLQAASGGRFVLGLGTQVKAHIERRFSEKWDQPLPRLREYVAAVRAIWRAFQGEERLRFRGDFYTHLLLSEFFDPGPIEQPRVPIYLAGVNAGMAKLVGECADGLHVHPMHSRQWLTDVMRPAIEDGARAASRSAADVVLACPVFVITGDEEQQARRRENVRQQLAFYAATPAYRPVLQLHDAGDLQPEINSFVRQGDVASAAALIDDDLLDLFSVTASWDDLAGVLRMRYQGVVDRLYPYGLGAAGLTDPGTADRWSSVAAELASG